MPIYFYSARERPYGCFSNFAPYGFLLDGKWWPTSEHYYQAQKFAGTPYEERIRKARSPKAAARMGRSRKHRPRDDWERVKDQVMRQAVWRKFETHVDIREVLLSTGETPIVENSPIDYYWGCGADGTGENRLGAILMDVRDTLREIDPATKDIDWDETNTTF